MGGPRFPSIFHSIESLFCVGEVPFRGTCFTFENSLRLVLFKIRKLFILLLGFKVTCSGTREGGEGGFLSELNVTTHNPRKREKRSGYFLPPLLFHTFKPKGRKRHVPIETRRRRRNSWLDIKKKSPLNGFSFLFFLYFPMMIYVCGFFSFVFVFYYSSSFTKSHADTTTLLERESHVIEEDEKLFFLDHEHCEPNRTQFPFILFFFSVENEEGE